MATGTLSAHNFVTSEEKDYSNHSSVTATGTNSPKMAENMTPAEALKHVNTSGSIAMSPEMFEKLYLAPEQKVKGELRKTFGNPTGLALLGLVMSLFPFSCDIMGWRGAGGNGAASTGAYYFMGGLLMIMGSIGEWILGNTFPFLVFGAYGGFWLSFAATLTPSIGAYGHYSTAYGLATDPSAGLDEVGFAASFGFYLLAMGILSLFFAIGTLRTNVCFAVIEWGLTVVFVLLAATFWQLAQGNASVANKCLTAAGAFGFVCSAAAWWILAALVLGSVDFPISLPLGDLSSVIKGASDKKPQEVNSPASSV